MWHLSFDEMHQYPFHLKSKTFILSSAKHKFTYLPTEHICDLVLNKGSPITSFSVSSFNYTLISEFECYSLLKVLTTIHSHTNKENSHIPDKQWVVLIYSHVHYLF
jgi:hypothetical protein